MEKVLKLYSYVDGNNDQPFPSSANQIEVSSFRYEAKRMGSAPIISCSIHHNTCLDDKWSKDVYVEFRGEKYYLKQTPTSSYSNTDVRYKHDVEFVSERSILDNVYFYDVVNENDQVDRVVSNSTSFTFSGDIEEFVTRLNKSLSRLNVGYSIVIDSGISSEVKLVEFDNQFITNALQEIQNTYNLKYYFVDKVIHVGEQQKKIDEVFEYGANESLLSISKNNANAKIINRITGIGSSDNIPFYYPNDDEKGVTQVLLNGSPNGVSIADTVKYRRVKSTDKFIFKGNAEYTVDLIGDAKKVLGNVSFIGDPEAQKNGYEVDFYYQIELEEGENVKISVSSSHSETRSLSYELIKTNGVNYGVNTSENIFSLSRGTYNIIVRWRFLVDEPFRFEEEAFNLIDEYIDVKAAIVVASNNVWTLNNIPVNLESYGISLSKDAKDGDKITIKRLLYIHPQKNLMPSIYRIQEGKERFYNAQNNTYRDENGNFYSFDNIYSSRHPKEHIETFEDIKPSIKNVKNSQNEYIDSFIDFAYDNNDNDEVDENNEFIHPYFYAKLRKFNGEYGFNLFNHAIENGEMNISMTSGSCASCQFTIMVDPDTQKNKVLVDDNGNLLRDNNGNVRFGNPIDKQNDTINNEVWIALKKDIDAYGVIMPNASNSYKPSKGDKFVILNIDLPKVYITQAEKKLEQELIKFMHENNSEKFNFSISFSRIFFAENNDLLQHLNENSKLTIKYNGNRYELFVSSYSYSVDANSALPEVKVELSDVLAIPQNQINQIISTTRRDILSKTSNNTTRADLKILSTSIESEIQNIRDEVYKPTQTTLSYDFFSRLFSAVDKDGKEIPFNDLNSKISYIKAKFSIASLGSLTMNLNDGSLNLPSIYDGLPLDNQTIFWSEVKDDEGNVTGRILKARVVATMLGDLTNVGKWANSIAVEDRIMVQRKGNASWESLELSKIGGGSADFSNVLSSGNGNAFTSFVLSEDKKTLTFFKDKTFAEKASSLEGYGITNAYTKSNVDSLLKGYITEITPVMVTTALGFTPYDSSNPNGYITSSALNGYATQTWVKNQGYLTQHQDLSGYQPLITSTNKLSYSLISGTPTSLKNPNSLSFGSKNYDGSAEMTLTASDLGALTSHQTIYTLTFQSGTFASGSFTANSANKTINVPTTTSHISEGSNLYFTNARAVSALTDTLKAYVTLTGTQTITGEKNFTGGLKVNGSPIVYDSRGFWKLEGDLLVTGGVSMYSSDTVFTPSTIMDGVVIDNVTIIKQNGKLVAVGVADSVAWGNVLGKPSWITDSKPVYYYSEISNTPDLSIYALKNAIPSLDGYAKLTDIPSLSGYATEQWVLGKGYATTSDLDGRINSLINGAPQAYDTLKEIADVLQGNVNSIGDIISTLGKKADKATTLSGYGITDAKIVNGVITLGSNTITPLTQSLGDARYVSGLGTSGNNLTWEINGKINNIIVPYSSKAGELNDFNVVTFSKNDNSGYPCYLLIADVTDWYNSSSDAATKGLMGFVYAYRDGFNPSYTLSLSAICSWGIGARALTSDMITVIEPCVVSYDGSYYLSLLLKGSNKTYKFIGRTKNLLSSFIELKCSSDGTFPGLEVIHSGSAKGTSYTAVKLAKKVKLWGNDFDGSESVNGNISNTGNIIPVGNGNESVGSKDKSFESIYADGYRWTENDSATIKSKGWYRFAESLIVDTIGNTCILSIRRVYANSEDESYMIAVTAGYNGAVSFTQISGRSRVNAITKIRATSDASGIVYFDFYYDSTKSNKVIVNGVGSVKTYVPTETLDKRTNVTEFELRKGFKAYEISGFSYQRNKSGKNLLTDGDLHIGDEAYLIGKYQYDTSVTNGRTYRVTLCAKLGEENEYISAFWDGGNTNGTKISSLSNTEERIVSFTAKITNKKTLSFYQYPNGKFGSYVRWAYLEEDFKEDELSEADYKAWSESHDKLDSKTFVHNLQRLDFSGGSYWSSDEGLNVNGGKLSYNATDKYWKLDGNLFVTGGITMFGNDSITAPTIMDAIHVDNKTISKANGYLEVIGGVGGGLNEEELNDYLNFKGYITNTVGDGRYLKRSLSGYTELTNSESGVLNFNSTSGIESGVRFLLKGVNGGGLWYHPSYGIYLYHANTGSKLGINESGTPYIGNNTLLHSGNYANYTPILNSSSAHATKDSVIYAPISAGTSGYVLKSNGSGAPSWIAQSNLSVGSAENATKATNDSDGNKINTTYLKLSGGVIKDGGNRMPFVIDTTDPNAPYIGFQSNGVDKVYIGGTLSSSVFMQAGRGADIAYSVFKVNTDGSAQLSTNSTYYDVWTDKNCGTKTAGTASKLSTVSKTAWGQTYWTSGGIPTNISGDMSNVGNITPSLHNTYSIGSYGNSFNWLNVNCISSGKISNGLWLCGGTNAGTGVVIARSGSNSATGEICRFTDVGMIWASGVLCTIATTGRELQLKYNNADANSIVLNSGSFKPFVSASNNLMLGRYDSLWNGVYLGIDSTSANNVRGVNFCDGSGYGIGHVSSSTTNLGIYSVGSVYLRGGCTKEANGVMKVSNTGAIIDSSGNMLVTGGVTMYSDIRKKTKLKDVSLTIKQIADAPLIEHYYNSDERKTTHVGSIAQYWYGMNDWFCKKDNEGFLIMEIQNCALASAISIARELDRYESKTDKKIKQLKNRISQLEDELEKLKS